jgi:uncharacterized membrane protein YedE/YeeE
MTYMNLMMKKLLNTAYFLAILTTGLAAGIASAHFLELPNKMILSAQEYLLVQQHLYEGFGRIVGSIEIIALLSTVVIAVLVRGQRQRLLLSLLASVFTVAALIIWQLNNGPVNEAVDSWTIGSMPPDWTVFRDRWEYAHALRAVLFTIALSVLIGSLLVFVKIEAHRLTCESSARDNVPESHNQLEWQRKTKSSS